jgi:NAD(P)-dependent dehydrogenase (short-subunit alcohol dehydrogenase family)
MSTVGLHQDSPPADPRPLAGRTALVAGATRGAGRTIAVELARAGAYVFATGRSSRVRGPSEIDRPETIEDTGDLLAAVGTGAAMVVDHTDAEAVEAMVDRIRREQGRLDILVNDMFGGDRYAQWDKPLWEHDLAGGWRMMEMGVHTHLITAAKAIPLMLDTAEETTGGLIVEMTDGTHEHNVRWRENVGFYYDLVKASVERILVGLTFELKEYPVTAVAVTPGWLRSEQMLDGFGVREQNWRDALEDEPEFGISESPTYVARGVAALAADPALKEHVGKVVTARQLADRYEVSDVDGSRPDCWGYLAVQATGDVVNVQNFR